MYTETLRTHKRFYIVTLLHTNACTQKHFLHTNVFYTLTLSNASTTTFPRKRFYRRTLLHTDAFTIVFLTLDLTFVSCQKRGCCRANQTRKKPSVFDTRTSFRAKRWPCCGASSVPLAAWREKRKRRRETVTEGKRARGQERNREREREREDVKMWRCEDVKMWRWEDEKMWRCEDERMWRCEDDKMTRCDEDVNIWGCIAGVHY